MYFENEQKMEEDFTPPGSEWFSRRLLRAVHTTYGNPAILLFVLISEWDEKGVRAIERVIPPGVERHVSGACEEHKGDVVL